jgi:hypothetical protein
MTNVEPLTRYLRWAPRGRSPDQNLSQRPMNYSEQKADPTLCLWFSERAQLRYKDIRGVEHSVEVTAETLYEAIATAPLAAGQPGRRDRSGNRNGDCSCPAATRKAPSQNEGLCVIRTQRTFSRRSHAEAKAGENVGQGKPRENVIENAKQTDQQKQIPEVSLTRSPNRSVGVLRLPRLRNTCFYEGGLRDRGTWCEGVLSFKQRRYNKTNQYHPTQQSPHENDWLPGNEDQHGTPPGTKSGVRFTAIVLPRVHTCFVNILPEVLRSDEKEVFPLPALFTRSCCFHRELKQLLAPPVPRSRCND